MHNKQYDKNTNLIYIYYIMLLASASLIAYKNIKKQIICT